MRVWFSGRIIPSQGIDGGSIPLTRYENLLIFNYQFSINYQLFNDLIFKRVQSIENS